ncbi:MAG: hypothetical protein JRE40_03335 [Deltaproteobacteria bacterium]|nr:hypothetical protein [Deltaproteobacteria bacterium]MBW2672977.1 hypothetical protein [Deltaproteobacteria bacterium]
MREKVKFNWKGPHHSYLGAFMVFWGYLMICADYGAFGYAFTALGFFVLTDDVVEHYITADTPLRLLFEKVIYPLVLRFNRVVKINEK